MSCVWVGVGGVRRPATDEHCTDMAPQSRQASTQRHLVHRRSEARARSVCRLAASGDGGTGPSKLLPHQARPDPAAQ